MSSLSKVNLALFIALIASPLFASPIDGNASGEFVNLGFQSNIWFAGVGSDVFEFGQ